MTHFNRLFRSGSLPVLLLALLVTLGYHYFWRTDATGAPKLIIRADFAYAYFPWFVYLSDTLRAGIWPLWCPYVAGGTPFFINPVTSLYSPITMLIALTIGYSEYVVQLQYVATIVVAALGAYALARVLECSRWGAFVAGLCFGLSSAVYSNIEHGVLLNGFALMPWLYWLLHRLLWVGDRRALLGLFPVYYLLITTGYQPLVVHIVIWMLVWAAFLARRSARPLAERLGGLAAMTFTGVLALVTSAIYWLPVLAFRSEFTRGQALSLEQALHGGDLHLRHYMGLVLNFITQHQLPGYNPDVSMSGVYIGVLALPLLVVGLVRRRDTWTWPLVIFTFVCAGMALGDQFPPRVWLHQLFPVLNFARYPAGDSRTLAALGMVLMAGRGWMVLASGDRGARAIGLAVLGSALAALAVAWFVVPGLYHPDEYAEFKTYFLLQIVLVMAALPVWWLAGHSLARGAFVALLVADLMLGVRTNIFVGGEVPPKDYMQTLTREHQTAFTVAPALVPRVRAVDLAPTVAGGSNDVPAGFGPINKRFYVGEYNPQRLVRFNKLLALGLETYLEQGPRVAFWPSQAPPTEARPFLQGVRSADFKIESYLPNSVTYTVHAPASGLLIFNEVYFPGWRARFAGQDQPLVPVLDGFRGLPVPAGDLRIETYFEPPIFYTSRSISLAGLVLWLCWLGWLFRRATRSSEPPAGNLDPR